MDFLKKKENLRQRAISLPENMRVAPLNSHRKESDHVS
jgi:hypothetical protein